jgi:hypothetical protein
MSWQGACGEDEQLTSWEPGSREEDRMGLGTRYIFLGDAPKGPLPPN